MNTIRKCAPHMVMVALVLGLSACAGMSTQDKNTAVGAGAGAVLGAVGGAAVGGVIGNQVNRH